MAVLIAIEVTRGGGGQAAVARVNCAMKAGRTYNIRFNMITNGGGGNNVIRLGTSTTAYTHDVASTSSGTGIFDVEYTAPQDFNHLWIYAYPVRRVILVLITIPKLKQYMSVVSIELQLPPVLI